MKLIKAKTRNFRLLKNVEILFDENTTSIVGKNNSGKTSLSVIFNLFLQGNKDKLIFEDFSLNCHCDFLKVYKLFKEITEETKESIIEEIKNNIPKIQLFITIQYGGSDNWANINPFFTNLIESDEFTILCEYAPDSTEKFLIDLSESMRGLKYSDDELIKKIELTFKDHYSIKIRPHSETEETENVHHNDLTKLIRAKFINAQRVLDDSNSDSKSKLSRVFQKQFSNENKQDISKSKEFLKIIEEASCGIDTELCSFFSPFINHFSTFGFPGVGNERVELKSQLEPDILFQNNIKLFYDHNGKKLPEKYNGLGYSNLIYIISQIIGFHSEIKEFQHNLNLIFIEEPEAHMHPQMQSVFIKNIEKFLKKVNLNAQIVITTHSSHILSDSKLEGIRYFTKLGSNNIAIIKDLMDFNKELTDPDTKKFLQQYLTLGKCDLFFADKAIFFEGTVERILLPVFIHKLENSNKNIKLSEKYISSIEIGGAYMNKFKELLEFLELKTLIITDIDSIKPDKREKTEITSEDNLLTSNVTLKDWIPAKEKITDLLLIESENKVKDNIMVSYQKNMAKKREQVKCGRSFEEAFVIENQEFIHNNKENLLSIKNHLTEYNSSDDILNNSYKIQRFIDRNKKKTEFAFDLLTNNKKDWQVPEYIKEGLEWLAK